MDVKVDSVRLHPRGHAHNDEMHKRPLAHSLEDGFTSIEVDTHLINGKLMVGHTRADAARMKLPLESTYLAPLLKRFQDYGAIYPGGPEVHLVLDLKAKGIYPALQTLLNKYDSMLVHVENGQVVGNGVKVILTGEKPQLDPEQDRNVFLDGSLRDLNKPLDPELTPTLSGDFRYYFRWNGKGEMPVNERQKLQNLVEQAHQKGATVRFWAAPDNPNTWKTLVDCGVDRVNTDLLDEFARWSDEQRN